jgi:uncharacterized protein YjiS (DUF1127 family)
MSALQSLITLVRRNQTRRAALADLRGLSAAQLSDIGLAPDGLGDVVASMMTQTERRSAATGGHARFDVGAQASGVLQGCG